MEGDLSVINVVSFNSKCLEFFGHICPTNYKTTRQRTLYFTWAFLYTSFTFGAYFCAEIAGIVVAWGDLESLTEASFLALTHFAQFFKLYSFIAKRHRVRNLIDGLEREIFKPRTEAQEQLLRENVVMSRRTSFIFLSAGVATCSLWSIFPFLEREEGAELAMPMKAWFPVNTSRSPNFEIIYVYEMYAVTINAMSNISIDLLFAALIMSIALQLSFLNDSLKNMAHKFGKRITKPGSDDTFDLEMKKELVANILHHREIIDFAIEYESLFTFPIFVQFCVSVIIICVTMFQLTVVPFGSLKFVSMILYQSCMLTEVFLTCYYGNEVMVRSRELTRSAWFSNWTVGSVEFKKYLIFFLCRADIDMRVKAGGFFTLSLETFMKILKSSWSYFAVLNSTKNK